MGNDEEDVSRVGGDVEEGEISDSDSIEETSTKQEVKEEKVLNESKQSKAESRVWTMQELLKYRVCGGYAASGLYNLAWSQAVQNKPLNEVFIEPELDEIAKRSSPSSSVAFDNSRQADTAIGDANAEEMDGEKEEGELEDGEIDLDSEPVREPGNDELRIDQSGAPMSSIQEVLESINAINVEKSLQEVCSRLESTLESLHEVFRDNSVSNKDVLVQLLFAKIQFVDTAFRAMNNSLKGQNKSVFLRLLSLAKSQSPPLFSWDNMKEIEGILATLNSSDMISAGSCNNDKMANISDELIKEVPCEKSSVASEAMLHGFRGRGPLLPLLDLHKDHDLDSLPSPTRETTPYLPALETFGVINGISTASIIGGKVALNNDLSRTHRYETDTLKAVSSYQQKFSHSSFQSNDLPSPTPSEESLDGDGDGGGTGGEVSSSSTISNSNTKNAYSPHADSSYVHRPLMAKPVAPVSAANLSMKTSAKSRDPRLRFANLEAGPLKLNPSLATHNVHKAEPVAETASLRRHKSADNDDIVDVPASKRRKSYLDNFGDFKNLKTAANTGGWLEDLDVVGPQTRDRSQLTGKTEPDLKKEDSAPNIGQPNVIIDKNVPSNGSNTIGSLPNILKDIAVNPTMLINILKMGQQQRLAVDTQQKSADPANNTMSSLRLNSNLADVPSINAAPSTPLVRTLSGARQTRLQTTEELGKVRMKARDPRRVLHGSTLIRTGSLGSEQLKVNGPPTTTAPLSKDSLDANKLAGHVQMNAMTSQSSVLADLTSPPMKSIINNADAMSVTQASVLSENHLVGAPKEGVGCPHPQNAWGDLEHLFEGYDEQQKSAIQRERARRIDQQKKMFAARKLCLVLDLDHTLLNSAKFVEIDPVHDAILRNKEEQDREKSDRHLFRFHQMGMWTKLRPGIWNFLEKASKLFELHLYTMGNRLYATEMAKVLDPKGVLFHGRVISKGDDVDVYDGNERVPKTKDLEGVLGMESEVVIIDDSVRVWPHNKLNLIVVERYTYFPCSRRQFGLSGPSLLEIDRDERPEDGTLASTLAVIARIHQLFYGHYSLEEADVRNILASEQRKILGGCRILFSRVFPVGEANPHQHPLWQMAEQFGAVCTNQIDDQVTHVVAIVPGTDKVNWALSTGRYAVLPSWVEASTLLYRRMNEHEFAVKPQAQP